MKKNFITLLIAKCQVDIPPNKKTHEGKCSCKNTKHYCQFKCKQCGYYCILNQSHKNYILVIMEI